MRDERASRIKDFFKFMLILELIGTAVYAIKIGPEGLKEWGCIILDPAGSEYVECEERLRKKSHSQRPHR